MAKTKAVHSFAALEHRIIDSAAYRDLTFSARALLVMLVQQETRDNNGHLQATEKYLAPYGFTSARTIGRAIAELIAHGLLYRTKSGGFRQGPAKYALTWKPIKRREGIFPQGFKEGAWRAWTEPEKKTRASKMQASDCTYDRLTDGAADISAAAPQDKSADIELLPVTFRNRRGAVSPAAQIRAA